MLLGHIRNQLSSTEIQRGKKGPGNLAAHTAGHYKLGLCGILPAQLHVCHCSPHPSISGEAAQREKGPGESGTENLHKGTVKKMTGC